MIVLGLREESGGVWNCWEGAEKEEEGLITQREEESRRVVSIEEHFALLGVK